jgi:hypothetical protein
LWDVTKPELTPEQQQQGAAQSNPKDDPDATINIPGTFSHKIAMPMREDDYGWISGDPFFHITDAWTWENVISKEGLKPQGVHGNPSHLGWQDEDDPLRSRQGHVYMYTTDLSEIVPRAKDDPDSVILAIDSTQLDPALVDSDEDAFTVDDETWAPAHPPGAVDPREWAEQSGKSWGDWADAYSDWVDHPDQTPVANRASQSIAYRGTVPPEAISLAWAHNHARMSSTDDWTLV